MKKDKKLIETMVFDDYGYAQEIKQESEQKLAKIKIGLIVAAVSTLLSLLGVMSMNSNIETLGAICLFFSFFGAIASYVIGGGFGIAFKFARKLAWIGWVIAPIPIDIVTGLLTLVVSVIAFFFVPLLFVFINYRQQNKNFKDAEDYLRHFKPISEVTNTVEN